MSERTQWVKLVEGHDHEVYPRHEQWGIFVDGILAATYQRAGYLGMNPDTGIYCISVHVDGSIKVDRQIYVIDEPTARRRCEEIAEGILRPFKSIEDLAYNISYRVMDSHRDKLTEINVYEILKDLKTIIRTASQAQTVKFSS